VGDRSGRGAAIRTARSNVNKKQYRRHIAAMIELYLERRPPRARERRWREPPLTPGNSGRLTAGWPTGSQFARRAIARLCRRSARDLQSGLNRHLLDECAIVAEPRRA